MELNDDSKPYALTNKLSDFFGVSPSALTVPDIDTDIGLMHTLFALEDIRGLTIGEIDGEITKEEYDCWRYNYPKYDTTQRWAKVPSDE